jgi:galactokinase
MSSIKSQVIELYRSRFGESPHTVVRAPGRVNLIGEHTDYNDGFVFPMAIDRAVWIALRPRQDKHVSVWSIDFQELIEFDLDALSRGKTHPREYMKGIAWALLGSGHTLTGWEGVLGGDVPVAAGLSSSAALELSTARAFTETSNIDWNPTEMAKLAQYAENQWVGMNCGIMDQLISAAGKADHALLIDCRTLETTPAPLPKDTAIVILDTGTRRALVDNAYNERREQCEAAAQFFGVPALRDVTMETFVANANGLDPVIRNRARHIISENDRTVAAMTAMRDNDAARMGQLMNQSHESLRDDYEVSSAALNSIVTIAQAQSGCYGARMTGAGFGGCAVALVESTAVDRFVDTVAPKYQDQTGNVPQVYVCNAAPGANVVG